MIDIIKDIVRLLLLEKKVDFVLGLHKDETGIIQPFLFSSTDQLDNLVIGPKWLFAKMAMSLLKSSPNGYRLGMITRGCDERAITELIKRNQIEKDRLHTVGVACSQEQAIACLCQRPYPEKLDAGDAPSEADPFKDKNVLSLLTGDNLSKMGKWARLLKRCIKCYGCRNSCPICVCVPCKLEDNLWVETGTVPAEMISYHFIRAFHLSDTCVACKACEDACPVNIPLLTLQLSMREFLRDTYGYEAGMDFEKRSPILYDFNKEGAPGQVLPDWINSAGKSR